MAEREAALAHPALRGICDVQEAQVPWRPRMAENGSVLDIRILTIFT